MLKNFKIKKNKKKHLMSAYVSAWVVIGMSLILVFIVITLALINYKREEEYMSRILSEKGAALIKSFEAGARTGMMGRFGSESRLSTLLKETSAQPDIEYIILTDPQGRILAHSNKFKSGSEFISAQVMDRLAPAEKSAWRVVQDLRGKKTFEVYKQFLPVVRRPAGQRDMQGMHQRMHRNNRGKQSNVPDWCAPGWMQGLPAEKLLDPEKRPVIFVGMDVAPFEDARAEDLRITAVTSGVLLLLGLAGFVSLFWAQNYTRSRKMLLDSRALASVIVNNLPAGLVVTDPEGKISYINEQALSLLNSSTNRAVGKYANKLLPQSLWELKGQIANKGQAVEKEISLLSRAEEKSTVAASASEIITDEGSLVGCIFILKDLSEIRRLQDKVKTREKMAAIGNLAAGIAHEVRNPLSSIKGYATFFGSLFEQGSSNKEAAEVMASEVDRLNRVISELLEFARPSDVKLSQIRVEELIDNSLRLITQEAENAGVVIDKYIDTSIVVNIDQDRMTQALLNLYINAIQAMDQGGHLGVSVSRENGNALRIEVSDTGKGIAVKDRTKIFDPYYTTKSKGTGLGLAIVQKIVEAHKGSVQLTSTEQGTVFSLIFAANIAEHF